MAKGKGKPAAQTNVAKQPEATTQPAVQTPPVATNETVAPASVEASGNDPFAELKALQALSTQRFGSGVVASETGKKGKKGTTAGTKPATESEVRKVLPFMLDAENLGRVEHVVDSMGCKGYSLGQDNDGNWIVCHLAKITPAVAMYLLASRNPHGKDGNRPLSEPLAKGYADDMREQNWGFAANALTFVGHDATIGDAQHQLKGIVESGTTQLFVVTYGVAPAFADYINGGKPRSPKDAIARHGHFERFAELWAKEGKQPAQVATLTTAHEKIFSEVIRTVGLRRLGLTVRGSHPEIKKKHVFRKLENLHESSTICVADVYTINRDTRQSKPNKKGVLVQSGKGALESLAQLAYFASAQYLASGTLVETVNPDESVDQKITIDMEIVKAIHAFWEDVADARNDAKDVVDGNYSAVNACRLRRFLEVCNTDKSGIAGASNNTYMAKFTAILLAVQKTLCGEEITPADFSAIRKNPTNVLWLDVSAIQPAVPAGLDDYGIRSEDLDDDTLDELSGEGTDDDDETDDSEESDDDESTDETDESDDGEE